MRCIDNFLLYTVDNDPESRLIYLIALLLGIRTITSPQPHGASFDKELGAVEKILATRLREVWTIELPGVNTEEAIRKCGIRVVTIDHHVYGTLDRAHDLETGERKKSSLEQFLASLELTVKEKMDLARNFRKIIDIDPNNTYRILYGIGILDDRYVKGLQETGYSNSEIRNVFHLREKLDRQLDPDYEARNKAAEAVWETRTRVEKFTVFRSDHPTTLAGALSTMAIQSLLITEAKDLENEPMIVSDCGGTKLRVLNVDAHDIARLDSAFENKHRFSYGAGRCWGTDNKHDDEPITLEEILAVLT